MKQRTKDILLIAGICGAIALAVVAGYLHGH